MKNDKHVHNGPTCGISPLQPPKLSLIEKENMPIKKKVYNGLKVCTVPKETGKDESPLPKDVPKEKRSYSSPSSISPVSGYGTSNHRCRNRPISFVSSSTSSNTTSPFNQSTESSSPRHSHNHHSNEGGARDYEGVSSPHSNMIDRTTQHGDRHLFQDQIAEKVNNSNRCSAYPPKKSLPPASSPKGRNACQLPLGDFSRIDNLADNGSIVPRYNRHTSQDSEYFNKLAAEHTKNKNVDLKFYESDADTENGSIIYTRYPRGGSGRTTDQSPSIDSVGIGNLVQQSNIISNSDNFNGHLSHSPRCYDNIMNNQVTPNISNLTNKLKSGNEIMPYQKRIAERQRESYDASASDQDPSTIYDDDEIDTHNSHHVDRPSGLYTISSPCLPPKPQNPRYNNHNNLYNGGAHKHYPPPIGVIGRSKSDSNAQNRHFGPHFNANSESTPHLRAPPLPPKYSTLPRRIPDQISRTNENDESKWNTGNNGLNIVHVRKNSGDSVSTFGSWTGGASSLCRIGAHNLTERLGTEIDDYIDNQSGGGNINDSEHDYQTQEKNTVKKESSSGIFSNILGSFSFSSAASVQSLEEETAEFHEKNQAFLQKSLISTNNVKPVSDLSSLQSLSPVPQRTHRPRLTSIDEGDKGKNKNKNERVSNLRRSSNYGSTNLGEPTNLDVTRKISNIKDMGLQSNYSSDESIDDDSCISSDFTSNQDGTLGTAASNASSAVSIDGSGQGNLSSLKLDSSSEGDISYDEDNGGLHSNEQTALLPSAGISSYEHGSGSINSKRLATHSRSRKVQRQSSRTPPGEREYYQSEKKNKTRRHYEERKGRRKDKVDRRCDRERSSKHEKHRYYNKHETDGRSGHNRRDIDRSSHNRRRDVDRTRHNRQDIYGRSRHNRRDKDEQYQDELRERYDADFSDELYSECEGYTEESNRRIYKLLRQQRQRLILEWKEELKEQEEALRAEREFNRWYNRLNRWVGRKFAKFEPYRVNAEQFISNLPLTIGAIALAIVTLGVVWFKFAEEMIDSCIPVEFISNDCTFPEFPGCFCCDTSEQMYKVALNIHTTCSAIAGIISMLFFAKLFLARRVVIDEMNQPTTSSPAGLICMTIVCVFAGRGLFGQIMVTTAAFLHFCLALWFIYMAITYHILPDPSWYPNTVGIGISAVKIWLYYPSLGHFLMATSLSLSFFFFPISLFRVAFNKKISAPVAWIQMSAPAVSLYALTIMAQPSHKDPTQYQHVHRMLYMPTMHVLFLAAIVGVISSVQGLIARWKTFSKTTFSPAHAAFCFPALAHVNAIHAYRSAVNSFTQKEALQTFKMVLDKYWLSTLVLSTIATIIITVKFFYKLPSWTCVDVRDEEEPPEPSATLISEFILAGDGETLMHDFVSPAVLQANETGALVRLPGREDGKTRYRRTRRVTALGFDPIMNLMDFYEERKKLLDWVETNPPRTRKRTLSVPHITYNLGQFGTNNSGVFNGIVGVPMGNEGNRRGRLQTSDGNYCTNNSIA